jgi:DNA-binding MarR family transcriptional regulator
VTASRRGTRFVDEIAAGRRQWEDRYGARAAATMEAVSNLVRVRELVVHAMEDCLSEIGLNHVEFDILTVIAAADVHTGIRLGRIGPRAQKYFGHQTSITNVVTRMAQRGLLRTERDPEDHRATRVTLTRVGAETLRRANDALTGAEFGIGVLTRAELAELTRLMTKIRTAHGDADQRME